MTTYIIRRLIQAFVVLLIVVMATFLALRLLPADPLILYIFENNLQNLSEADMQALRVQFGLDKPLYMQFVVWLGDVLHGDFGTSLFYRMKVSDMVAQRMPVTVHLGILAFIVSTVFGIFFGIVAGMRRTSWMDYTANLLAYFGITTPNFWLAVLLMYVFALKLNLLPVQGYMSPFQDFWQSTRLIILPVFVLGTEGIASLTRYTRSQVLEVNRQDYVRTAWSKGLRERVVILRHILKNGLIPVVTILGVRVRNIFSGTVIIETVFNIPGMGRMSVEAVFGQDYIVVQAVVLLTATIVVITNLLVDLTYVWIDPRVKFD